MLLLMALECQTPTHFHLITTIRVPEVLQLLVQFRQKSMGRSSLINMSSFKLSVEESIRK